MFQLARGTSAPGLEEACRSVRTCSCSAAFCNAIPLHIHYSPVTSLVHPDVRPLVLLVFSVHGLGPAVNRSGRSGGFRRQHDSITIEREVEPALMSTPPTVEEDLTMSSSLRTNQDSYVFRVDPVEKEQQRQDASDLSGPIQRTVRRRSLGVRTRGRTSLTSTEISTVVKPLSAVFRPRSLRLQSRGLEKHSRPHYQRVQSYAVVIIPRTHGRTRHLVLSSSDRQSVSCAVAERICRQDQDQDQDRSGAAEEEEEEEEEENQEGEREKEENDFRSVSFDCVSFFCPDKQLSRLCGECFLRCWMMCDWNRGQN
ncbi:hypothetical protein F2P81_018936 [Scophthalmus maximus]|uniref:Uncharacterized protein n=1 Tax=Scophthalmus maximus TaxID=52904 RepID=A0A6A4SF99_SCOMX|nr:hypothetical protein F2P81_018936 [Scophthalmus maximus]